jgi:hypothetical protein
MNYNYVQFKASDQTMDETAGVDKKLEDECLKSNFCNIGLAESFEFREMYQLMLRAYKDSLQRDEESDDDNLLRPGTSVM